jgi:hypothetical protein
MRRESQTLTLIFLLKHNYSLTWHHISSFPYRKTIARNHTCHIQWSIWKFLSISFLNIHHFGTNCITCANYRYYHHLSKRFKWSMRVQIFLQNFSLSNSQNNISEAWELISSKFQSRQFSKRFKWSKRINFYKISSTLKII